MVMLPSPESDHSSELYQTESIRVTWVFHGRDLTVKSVNGETTLFGKRSITNGHKSVDRNRFIDDNSYGRLLAAYRSTAGKAAAQNGCWLNFPAFREKKNRLDVKTNDRFAKPLLTILGYNPRLNFRVKAKIVG
jgi:hypothetical protein